MKKMYEEEAIRDIAVAIREKNGTDNIYTATQMGDAVRAIKTQPDLEVLNATENGNYLPSAGKDGFSEVNVQVSSGINYYPSISGPGYIDEKDAVLCRLDGRTFTKWNNEPACAAYYTNSRYTCLILISMTPEGAWYNAGTGWTAKNTVTIEKDNHTYYITSPGYSMEGKLDSTAGIAYKLSENRIDYEEAKMLLLENSYAETLVIEQPGLYTTPEGYTGIKNVRVQNIKSGISEPPAFYYGNQNPNKLAIGKYGDCYRMQATEYIDPVNTNVLFYADEDYVVSSNTQVLSTHAVAFNKLQDGPAIAIECRISKEPDIIGPILISPVEEYVKTTGSSDVLGTAVVDDITWYISTPSNFDSSLDSPTIPIYYDYADDLGPIPDPITTEYAIKLINKFLDLASASASINRRNIMFTKVLDRWQKCNNVNIQSPYFYISTNKGQKYRFNERTGTRVLSNNIPLVWAAAKTSTGYIAPAFYSLKEYSSYDIVVTGSYLVKRAYTIINPFDNITPVTVYGYGSFNGGYQNATSTLYDASNNVLLSVPNNAEFFAPYATDGNNPSYNNAPLELKKQFFEALLTTR